MREGYDLAIRMGALGDSGLVARPLGRADYVLVASPAYLDRRGTPQSVEDLHQHAGLRYLTAGRPLPWTFADGRTVVPDGPLDTDDGGALREATLKGAGIAFLFRFAVADDLAAGRLQAVLPGVALPTVPVQVLHAFGRQLPVRARLFGDFLASRFSQQQAP